VGEKKNIYKIFIVNLARVVVGERVNIGQAQTVQTALINFNNWRTNA
jgi:hypothetical protein